MNLGPRGTGNKKPSSNPGHPQEPVRKKCLRHLLMLGCRSVLPSPWHWEFSSMNRFDGTDSNPKSRKDHTVPFENHFQRGFRLRLWIQLMYPIATTFVSLYLIHPSSMIVRGFKESKNKLFVMS